MRCSSRGHLTSARKRSAGSTTCWSSGHCVRRAPRRHWVLCVCIQLCDRRDLCIWLRGADCGSGNGSASRRMDVDGVWCIELDLKHPSSETAPVRNAPSSHWREAQESSLWDICTKWCRVSPNLARKNLPIFNKEIE